MKTIAQYQAAMKSGNQLFIAQAIMKEALTFEYSEVPTEYKAKVKVFLGLPLEDHEEHALEIWLNRKTNAEA